VAYALFPGQLNSALCDFLLAGPYQKYCQDLVSDTSYSEMLVGAPVFSAFSCPSGRKGAGLLGLVYSLNRAPLNPVTVGDYKFASLTYVLGPGNTDGKYIDADLYRYAQQLGVHEVLFMSRTYVSGANRAESEIVAALGLSPVIVSVLVAMVPWSLDWAQVYQ